MWVEDYKWHYDYVRLAWDTGFSFDNWKSPNLDKNKICVVDVDRIVRERDVASVDRYISTVVQYILDDEQAKVLDINFVKIFKLSQLAVEFLLFCKKYLDNTVILLKRELTNSREENKELKTFVDDLQSHIDALTKQQVLATFKCSICSKAFSSDEYLNAHIKRRHNNPNSESYNVETDKLNLEIKELKERLNNTEKLLKHKDEQSNEKILHNYGNNDSKMDTLLDKFEQFKVKVDVELKELKMQKSFYEENYGRLFDIMINSKENVEPKYDTIKNLAIAETTTQTDKLLYMDNVHNINVLEIQEPLSISCNKAKEEVLYEEENNFKGNLEAKISTTLAGIEDQMQTFWNKLNEIEKTKIATDFQPDLELLDQVKDIITSESAKPKIKPRSKFSQPTHNTIIVTGENTENLKLAISKLEQAQQAEQKKSQSKHNEAQVHKNLNSVSQNPIQTISNILPDIQNSIVSEDLFDGSKLEEESSLESQTSESQSLSAAQREAVLVKPSASILGKPSITSFNKISSNKEVLKNLNKEIQEVVFSRIEELGISKSWSGIPQRSFEKSLDILNHQAALTKRTYSNFDLLKKKINGVVEKQCTGKTSGTIKLQTAPKKHKIKEAQNVVKISYRPKSNKTTVKKRKANVSSKREIVEIKNRALYDTDTESEKHFKASSLKVPTSPSQPHQVYSEVVNDFKSLTTAKLLKNQDSDLDDFNKKDDMQKGVLKNFPSIGSLSKKKVLFDLDNDFRKKDETPLVQKTGGSTTSVASSILEHSMKGDDDLVEYKEKDESKNKEKEDKIEEKDLNDLSDFDFSDS